MTTPLTIEQRSEEAWKRAHLTFHGRHDEEWRNKLAAELNVILARVQYEMETCLPPDQYDVEFAEAALSVCERVANFEEIERMVTSAHLNKE
jgi:hypothetical protein